MQPLIVWFEIPVFNLERAMEFYANVFRHIRFEVNEFSGARHAVFTSVFSNAPFQMSGSLVEHRDEKREPFGPVLFFDANLGMSTMLEAVKQNGGEVLLEKTLIRNYRPDGTIVIPKTRIDNQHGYYAFFKDSEGNKMGLYSNS